MKTPISDALNRFRLALEDTGLCQRGDTLAVRLNSHHMGAAFVNELAPLLDRRSLNHAYLSSACKFNGMDITWPSISDAAAD